MKLVCSTFVSIVFMLVCTVAAAQDSENPPVLKLDRIPSLPAFAGQTRAPAAAKSDYKVETVVGGLSVPWGLAFLPDGTIVINEYTGAMRLVSVGGELSDPIKGLPETSHEGWAGLFDLTIDPEFAKNRWIYFSYTAPSGNEDAPNVPRVARGRLNKSALRLEDVEVIVDAFGQQEMHFATDGTLFLSGAAIEGDGQDLSSHAGKLLRINADGSTPSDNPVFGDSDQPSAIFSIGHRDVSGIASHPETGDIWITEHGPRGGDELNRIVRGANYGWPIYTFGTDYTGEPMADGMTSGDGISQPRYFWRPSIAPSGLMFYSGDMFPEWRGNIFVTALSGQHITRLVMIDDRVVAEERMLVERGERIRELKQGPDGALYALTNEEGDAPKGSAELLRISR